MVLEDRAPRNPRDDARFGKLVCFNNAARIGDAHSYADSETFLRELINQTAAPDDVVQFIITNKSDALRLQRADNGIWGLYSYDASFGRWTALMYYDMPPMENPAGAKAGILDEMRGGDMLRLASAYNLILPVYLHEGAKEGVTAAPPLGGASAEAWGNIQIGWVYASHADILKTFNENSITRSLLDSAESLLRGEISVYDSYLRGDCYRYVLLIGTEKVIRQNGLIGSFDDIKDDLADVLPEECRYLIDSLEYVDETAAADTNFTVQPNNSMLPAKQEPAPAEDNETGVSIEAQAAPAGSRNSGVLGTASVTVGGIIIINDLSIERGRKGVTVLMPQSKDGDGKPYEICSPVTKGIRERIAKAVVESYNAEAEKQRAKKALSLSESERG
ncbi:MAG: SpoVG family protein [Clostridiales bacterium]|jgi:DNA-binding cell septation regulator SpoVG|nr:SpoVG family protein [Clostridiales bacterium]